MMGAVVHRALRTARGTLDKMRTAPACAEAHVESMSVF